ncbi:MAG: epoxyqueuosine reductase [Halanaerobiales bacterium]
MINSENLKELILNMGADLCGIAPATRFKKAPEGFRPEDIYKGCKSVIVYAKKVPHGSLDICSCIPYTHINNILTQEVDKLGVRISLKLEKMDIKAVPIPSDDPYEYWEEDNSYGRAILSMRHSGYLAGLGVLGKNTLLINEKYGNMIQIGAVLVDIELEGDSIIEDDFCPAHCSICIDSCPQKALDGKTVNQELCRPLSNYQNEKGFILKKCNICRRVCPKSGGVTGNFA